MKNMYDALASAIYISKLTLNHEEIKTDDQRIRASGLYDDWTPGEYKPGDIRNANGQTWECFQAHDTAIYPDIVPDGAAWATFWRPLHGLTAYTAREFVPVTGAHDRYLFGQYAIYKGKTYRCIQDTAYSPDDEPGAWEIKE